MSINKEAYKILRSELDAKKITLVAVSKTKPVEDIKELYDLGHRDFAENYVQELEEKHKQLPADIRWHFIGHLQTNKVKQIASFVQLIQSVDSLKLLKEINKQAEKNNRVIDCLLQVYIAQEETKFGLDEKELNEILNTNSSELNELKNVRVVGLMGMASFTDDMQKVRDEFRFLKTLYDRQPPFTIHHSPFTILSMGMSADYKIAMEEGSNMVRIGSLLFGERAKNI
jgi:pyridoxal phosphate enzyme (YggS family)